MEPITAASITAALVSGLSTNFGKQVLAIAAGFWEKTSPIETLKQQFFNASTEYLQRYVERHGQLQVLGMSRPVSLDEVYTRVQLLEAEEIRCFDSLEGLEELYRLA